MLTKWSKVFDYVIFYMSSIKKFQFRLFIAGKIQDGDQRNSVTVETKYIEKNFPVMLSIMLCTA